MRECLCMCFFNRHFPIYTLTSVLVYILCIRFWLLFWEVYSSENKKMIILMCRSDICWMIWECHWLDDVLNIKILFLSSLSPGIYFGFLRKMRDCEYGWIHTLAIVWSGKTLFPFSVFWISTDKNHLWILVDDE